MVWQIEFDPAAQKELKKPVPQAAKRILEFLKKRLATQTDPRKLGQALKGSKLGDFGNIELATFESSQASKTEGFVFSF